MIIATDNSAYRGNRMVILENNLLSLTVLPELGAKIYDLIYKPTQKNLLWHHPRIFPHKVPLGAAFDDVWAGGWDEIFPNDAPCIVGGERYPDMGEVWSTEWDYSIIRNDPQSATLSTITKTPISASRLTRTITIREDEASLSIRYLIENIGQDTLRFLWKIHPAFDVNETCTIHIPAKTGIVDPRYRQLYSKSSQKYPWPKVRSRDGVTVDLSSVPLASTHICSLHYVTDLSDGFVVLRNPRDNVDVRINFDKETLHTIWLFLDYGGYRSLYTAVIEPSTSYPYDLSQAIREGRFSRLEPGQQLSCRIDLQVLPHSNV